MHYIPTLISYKMCNACYLGFLSTICLIIKEVTLLSTAAFRCITHQIFGYRAEFSGKWGAYFTCHPKCSVLRKKKTQVADKHQTAIATGRYLLKKI